MNNIEFFKFLKHVSLNLSIDIRVMSYSGRGMCGKRCIAIATDAEGITIGAELVLAADEDKQHDIADILAHTRSDSLGLNSVYYWPKLEWDETEMNDNQDEEGE